MISKLPNVTTSIFTVMSKMASDYNALNLSQGFPNFKSDSYLIELVNKAMTEGYNQYAPMSGYLELRKQRHNLVKYFIEQIDLVAKKYNERLLISKKNTISFGITLTHENNKHLTSFGSMLFTRGVSGSRVVSNVQNQKTNLPKMQ